MKFYLLSGLDLLGPAALRPLLVDLSLLPGFPDKLLAGAVDITYSQYRY